MPFLLEIGIKVNSPSKTLTFFGHGYVCLSADASWKVEGLLGWGNCSCVGVEMVSSVYITVYLSIVGILYISHPPLKL
jgi:hypothetical protein